MKFTIIAVHILCIPLLTRAQPAGDASPWSFHFQQTVIGQYHFDFRSPYSGTNSLASHEDAAYSVTSTMFVGCRITDGTQVFFDPELAAGGGLSGATGVAGALNGETYRIGDPKPSLAIARLYVQQDIALSDERTRTEDAANAVAGTQPLRRITITAGKYGITDRFDANSVSHDPRTQFLNWSLMSAGAWDYPADTKGYTIGATVEYIAPEISLRAAASMVPYEANQAVFDRNVAHAHSGTIEVEVPHRLFERQGVVRLLVFHTTARMGDYAEALRQHGTPDITTTRTYGRAKYGFDLNLEQPLSAVLSGFVRASWNDGSTETWMFTEIDRSLSIGTALDGAFRSAGLDGARAAVVVNGISNLHRDYLAAGGNGFILGDGALGYGPEAIAEVQYATRIAEFFTLSADAQYVLNPGFNRDRGPVGVVALRGHVEM
ncbi:MAG: carbohydrate porin [Bacteroidetes bacterium]|nr:carbohydrate porin [Bacteroidota bacterium]